MKTALAYTNVAEFRATGKIVVHVEVPTVEGSEYFYPEFTALVGSIRKQRAETAFDDVGIISRHGDYLTTYVTRPVRLTSSGVGTGNEPDAEVARMFSFVREQFRNIIYARLRGEMQEVVPRFNELRDRKDEIERLLRLL